MREREITRRELFARAGLVTFGLAATGGLASCKLTARAGVSKFSWGDKKEDQTEKVTEEEVGPPEDLMREHGVLDRLLLVYEDQQRKLLRARDYNVDAVRRSADLIKRFIEDYHERQEEEEIFPRFEGGGGEMAELVATLRRQHDAGRLITADIMREVAGSMDRTAAMRIGVRIGEFIRMYRPHAAREETVLFPALHKLVAKKEFDELGERFEKREYEMFGEGGFEKIVAQVADIEKMAGIYELEQFTPRGG